MLKFNGQYTDNHLAEIIRGRYHSDPLNGDVYGQQKGRHRNILL